MEHGVLYTVSLVASSLIPHPSAFFDCMMKSGHAIGGGLRLLVSSITRGQPHPKYKANSARTSHIVVWERDPQLLGVTGNELHDGAERGPVDRDGARSTKSKHGTSSIRGLRVSPGRFVWL